MDDPVLEVRDLTVEFTTHGGHFTAVQNASFTVRRGEVLAIVGESGSGKSVMTQSLVKLIPSPPSRITGGSAVFEGQDLVPLKPEDLRRIRGRKIGVIFQDAMTALNPTMRIGLQISESLREHFHFRGKKRAALIRVLLDRLKNGENREEIIDWWIREFFYGEDDLSPWRRDLLSLLEAKDPLPGLDRWIKTTGGMTAARAKAITLRLLEMVKIPDPAKRFHQYIFQLSGGMRQRIMIAMAMACRPSLIIADEPTTALDVTIKGEVLDLLIELKRRLGISVVLITHDLGIVASYADRIGVLYAGGLVEMGTVDDMFYHPRHPYTLGLLHSIPRLETSMDKALEPITGSPPNPLERRPGCAFADRCRYAMKICYIKNPAPRDICETHWAACFLPDERAVSAAALVGYQGEPG
ncbi:MAG: ABC transporter ATP-binding protein [Treponema sp.]|jgi:oligopeptide/dipeptide ABC transporter ATP-binding protein|nr:ABC transporter ATP-binding protein [Treponema sp.]